MNLYNEIITLISLKQEGNYWDFKKEWHSNNSDLLHDIICMSNNLANKDAYIIIGVDQDDNYNLQNVEKDANRKTTQNIVDFLKDKSFFGGIRPIVYVETLIIDDNKIDVIVVKNSYNTPFFLTKNTNGVIANRIYTRIMDTNTPKDKDADPDKIEYLWKKRFHLFDTPIDLYKYYLMDKDSWITNENGEYYYKFHPEYRIIPKDSDDDGYVYYLFSQTDSRPHWVDYKLMFYNTELLSIRGNYFDGGRWNSSAPLTTGVSLSHYQHKWDIIIKYYLKDSLEYSLHKFLVDILNQENQYSISKFLSTVIVLNDSNELECFKEYVRCNFEDARKKYCDEINLPYFPNIKGYIMDVFKEEYLQSIILNKMLEEFRVEKNIHN